MFDWLGDIFSGIGNAIGSTFEALGEQISNVIWNTMLQWLYETIYNAVADFFTMMGNMGADIFQLDWIQATIRLFTLFGWALFAAGVVVAIFDVAIEYQCGRANIKTTAINILKGFFACSLIGIVPVELYKFCVSLQNTFSHDLSAIFAGGRSIDLAGESTSVLVGSFSVANNVSFNLFNILALIAFAYCVIKIFFANIKRGGILLIQIAVGSLYMFSVPRGYVPLPVLDPVEFCIRGYPADPTISFIPSPLKSSIIRNMRRPTRNTSWWTSTQMKRSPAHEWTSGMI